MKTWIVVVSYGSYQYISKQCETRLEARVCGAQILNRVKGLYAAKPKGQKGKKPQVAIYYKPSNPTAQLEETS